MRVRYYQWIIIAFAPVLTIAGSQLASNGYTTASAVLGWIVTAMLVFVNITLLYHRKGYIVDKD